MRLLLLLTLLLVTTSGWADPQSKSFSSWRFEGTDAIAVFTIGQREVTRLPAYQYNGDLALLLSGQLRQTITLSNDGEDCPLLTLQPQRAAQGYLQQRLQFRCSQPIAQLDIGISTLLRESPSHVHFAKFQTTAANPDRPPFERLFSQRQPQQQLNLAADDEAAPLPAGETLLMYTVLGFEHILIGLDHIAFLLTLMLLAKRFRDVVFIVTGFTLGHSITLSLATLGLVTPNSMLVEALIGFTIALVAIENIGARHGSALRAAMVSGACLLVLAGYSLWHSGDPNSTLPPTLTLLGLALFSFCYLRLSDTPDQARKLRPAITAGFGLIHGFGFANVLMEVGLPSQRIVPALFGFNIGVELGQLAIVTALALAALAAGKMLGRQRALTASDGLSAALCGLGVFWFIQRAYF